MTTMVGEYRIADSVLRDLVLDRVGSRGVPTTLGRAADLAGDLYPDMLGVRARLSARERDLLVKQFTGVIVPDGGGYSVVSLEKLTYRAAGLSPSAPLTEIEAYDPLTQTMATQRVAPWTMPDDEAAIKAFVDRLTAGMGRHARGASRDLVLATASANRMRWARSLSGAENCAWCAMLASRGAVYTEKSVRFQAHDHCDCSAELVPSADQWRGRDEAIRLRELWDEAGDLTTFTKLLRGADEMAA